MPPTVLLLESDPDRQERLAFLLKIAGYLPHRVTSVAEACNWSKTCGNTACADHCLLVGSLEPAEDVAQLLNQLNACQAELPVLFVDRISPPLAHAAANRWQLQGSNLHICAPTDITDALAAILRPLKATLSTRFTSQPMEVVR